MGVIRDSFCIKLAFASKYHYLNLFINFFREGGMGKTCSRVSHNCTYAHNLKELRKTKYSQQKNYLSYHNCEQQSNNGLQSINIGNGPQSIQQQSTNINSLLINLIPIQAKEKSCKTLIFIIISFLANTICQSTILPVMYQSTALPASLPVKINVFFTIILNSF